MSNYIKLFLNRALLSSTLGNALEWYDFTLYAALAPIIASEFFPTKNDLTSLILTFGALAAGFLMRPLGGIIYGHIGDRYGRKKALISSIILMTIPTLILGLLPTYKNIGIFASLLITLTILLQGLAVGGEFTGTISFLVETAPNNRRGLAGSFALIGVLGGILLAAAIVSLISFLLSAKNLSLWGWRIPFLLGGLLGAGIFLLRRTLDETSVFKKAVQTNVIVHTPFETCLLYYKKNLFRAFGVTVFNAFGFYITMIYTITYFNRVIHMPMAKASAINLFMVGLTLLLTPVAGILSDRIGRKKTLGIAALGFIILGLPMNIVFLSHIRLLPFLLGQALICVLLALYIGPLATTLAEIFPTQVRYTGIAIAYNTALALFGGTSPLLVTFFIEKTHILPIPGILLTLSAIFSFIIILSLRETYKEPLN